jgi:hypothetical protein
MEHLKDRKSLGKLPFQLIIEGVEVGLRGWERLWETQKEWRSLCV